MHCLCVSEIGVKVVLFLEKSIVAARVKGREGKRCRGVGD